MVDSSDIEKDLDAVLGAAAKLLMQRGHLLEASILATSDTKVRHQEHDNWNGGQDVWSLLLGISADTYMALENREQTQKNINAAIAIPMEAVSSSDFIDTQIITALEKDPEWRTRTLQHVSGETISNQGHAYSKNVAAREYDGLLFRSRPEIMFYNALKDSGAVFAPLSVVVCGSTLGQKPRRIEPDFVIFKDGLVTVVEIDGDQFHTETPVKAEQRLKFLLDEGPGLVRLNANECDTSQKAKEAAGRVMFGIEKRLRSKV